MQRVVRSTLVGLLTIAGLAACGDKVTVPPPVTQTPDATVHLVTVSPSQLTLTLPGTGTSGKATLAAAVTAGAGVTNRTVTWTTGNAAVASVGTDGTVTAVGAGTTTITAASVADPTVKGAASVTVLAAGGSGGAPTVTISSINQTNFAGQSVPAILTNIFGQIDVILNVDANGQALKSVAIKIKSGTDSVTVTQTITGSLALDASGATAPVTLSINTGQFNPTTGIPLLRNNVAATITASATTNATTPQTATSTQTFTLNNVDGAAYTTAMSGGSASDGTGLQWKAGNATVSVLPVLYSGKALTSMSITLAGTPGAIVTGAGINTPTQSGITAVVGGPTTAVWSGSATTGARTTNTQVTGPVDGNGFVTGVRPAALVIYTDGTDAALPALFSPTGALVPAAVAVPASDVRIDNLAPAAPTVFTIPTPVSATNATGQNGWVNAAYVFAGTSATRYNSGNDAGVSAAALSSGLPATTVTYWYAPASGYPFVGGAAVPATGVGTACTTTGLTQVTANAGELAVSLTNTQYRVRVNETDKLGNIRCTDLGQPGGQATFGVDKAAPIDSFATLSAPDKYAANIANAGAIANFVIAYSDTGAASLFAINPALATLLRAYPGLTAAQSCVLGNFANGACGVSTQSSTVAVNGTGGAALGTEGYYTLSSTIRDQAQNAGATLTRQAVVDVTAPVMGGVSVPSTILGGQSTAFGTSATDNLDLVSSDYTFAYGTNIANPPAGSLRLKIRTPTGPALGVAFDNVLTTNMVFTINVGSFVRNIQVTNGTDNPVALALPANQPDSIIVRATDGAGNVGSSGDVTIGAANVVQIATTAPAIPAALNYAGVAGFGTWRITNAATNICNVATCATPGTPTAVLLTAAASGTIAGFQVPFTQVQFYYFDTGYAGASNEWILITTSGSQSGTTVGGLPVYSWSVSFDPPAILGTGVQLNVMAVGMNPYGDALASRDNANIALIL